MKSVASVRAVPHLLGGRIDLMWQNPLSEAFAGAPPFAGVRIMRRERTFPRAWDDGVVVYDGPVISQFADQGLEPLTTYYYTVFTVDSASPPGYYADDQSTAAALATQDYQSAEQLYRLLPAVHQRADTPLSPAELAGLDAAVISALNALPPDLRNRGQLRRFLHVFGASLDLMRSLAEGLRRLHDVDQARHDFLLPLAEWIDWKLDHTLPVFAQRNEVKFAPRLYRSVGTVPNLRAIVNRYTGWYAQVAEFAQHIARSNMPPQLNIFAMLEEASGWCGTDDAAPVLGFGDGNDEASGSGSLPGKLVSSLTEPFALRPDMEFAITADDRVPVVVRFRRGDFIDINQATVAEVVAVFNRTLSEVAASAHHDPANNLDGRIELSSHSVGMDSSLRVEHYAASLVTLEGAPRGRLSPFVDSTDRVRLFYEAADPLAPAMTQAVTQALSGEPFPSGLLPDQDGPSLDSHVGALPIQLPSLPQGQVRYKTFRSGAWGESYSLDVATPPGQGDPAPVELPDGRIWVAWIDGAITDSTRLRFTVGTPRTSQAAQLIGQRSQPFIIQPGMQLLFRGNWGDAQGFEFAAAEFANPQLATAAEVASALNSRLNGIVASVRPNLTVQIHTTALGGDQRLELDLRESSAAQAIGFDARNAVGAGEWGDVIDWQAPQDVTPATTGRHTDLNSVVDSLGGVWLFWAAHNGTNWNIVSARWDGTNWSPPETLAEGLGGNREPCAVLDSTNRLWLIWARRQGVGTPEDIWTLRFRVFDPGTSTWSAEAAATTAPSGGRASDREPGVVRMSNGDLRVLFSSDRAGGSDLWSLTITPATSTMSAPSALTADSFADHAPAPINMPDGSSWLLYRTDRSVPLVRVATRSFPMVENRVTFPASRVTDFPPGPLLSVRTQDTGTLRRFAGTVSVVRADAARNSRRRQWDDLLAYTPQKPFGIGRDEILQEDDLYTRGTVGLYLSQVVPDSPLSQQRVARLRPVLERYLPINVRAVVILAPRVDIEYLYRPGADIQETYLDKYPQVEYYTGLGDSAAAAAPDWIFLLSTTPGHVSANPADLTTLRRRTYFPPPL